MSEGKKDGISRRDFLKGVGIVALGATGITKGVEWFADFSKDSPFSEIPNGTKFPLDVDGKGDRDVYLFYANNDVGKLCIRREGVVNFSDGAETVRMLGEITDTTLKKVIGKNPSLAENITVSVYPTASGSQIKSEGRQELPDTKDIYALPVITRNMDYMQDGTQVPFEKNKNASGNSDNRNLDKFGQGLAIGKLDSDSGNFTILGYVCDARAVELG